VLVRRHTNYVSSNFAVMHDLLQRWLFAFDLTADGAKARYGKFYHPHAVSTSRDTHHADPSIQTSGKASPALPLPTHRRALDPKTPVSSPSVSQPPAGRDILTWHAGREAGLASFLLDAENRTRLAPRTCPPSWYRCAPLGAGKKVHAGGTVQRRRGEARCWLYGEIPLLGGLWWDRGSVDVGCGYLM
jgi:hypothetical protein